MARKQGKASATGVTKLSPQERHRKFVKENGEWNKKVEKALTKLEKAADGQSPAPQGS
jgi:hypothetical protein